MGMNESPDIRLAAGTCLGVPFLDRLFPAKAAGFSGISMTLGDYETLRSAGYSPAQIRQRITDAGLLLSEFEAVTNWLPVPGTATGPWANIAPFLGTATPQVVCPIAAELGAEAVLCVEMLPSGLDLAARARGFAQTCDIAAALGLRVVLEFLPTSAIADLATARAIVEGADRSNGALLIDTWHFQRTGASLADLCALPGHLIGAIQISDAPLAPERDLAHAMMHERLLPGAGELPLTCWLSAIRATGSAAPVAVEVISDALSALPMAQLARAAYQSAHRLCKPCAPNHPDLSDHCMPLLLTLPTQEKHCPPESPRGNMRQRAQRAVTRDRVVAAAVQVFAAKGYASATVEDILGQAGVSRATFYAHFTGKIGVLDAIADGFAPAWTQLWHELVVAPEMIALRAWCARHLEIYRQHDALCVIITQGAAIEPEFYARLARDQEALIDQLAAHPALAHLATDPAARMRAALTLNQIDNACYFLAVRRRQADPGAGIEAMANMLRHFFEGEEMQRRSA